MRNLLLSTLIAGTLAGCAATSVTYEVDGHRVEGERNGAQLIAEHSTGAAVTQKSGSDQPPRLISSVAPVMPREAITRGIEGDVLVELSIDPQGNVSDVKILESSDDIFSEVVLAAMKKWRFSPLIEHGVPRKFKTRQTYKFRVSP